MSDYLGKLAGKSAEPEVAVTPRVPSRFEAVGSVPWHGAPLAADEQGFAVEEAEQPAAPSAPSEGPPRPPQPADGAASGGPELPVGAESSRPARQGPAIEAEPAFRPATRLPERDPSPGTPSVTNPAPLPAASGREATEPQTHRDPAPDRLPPLVQETIVEREVVEVHHDASGQPSEVRVILADLAAAAEPRRRNGHDAAPPEPRPARAARTEETARQPQAERVPPLAGPQIQPRVRPASGLLHPASGPEPPTVNVSIGRIEVRATKAPAEPPPARSQPPARPAESSLAAYLKQRANGEIG